VRGRRLEKEIRQMYLTHVLKGNKEGLKKFKLRVEDPPRRKHMVRRSSSNCNLTTCLA
jgi:hypothetical protein